MYQAFGLHFFFNTKRQLKIHIPVLSENIHVEELCTIETFLSVLGVHYSRNVRHMCGCRKFRKRLVKLS